MKNILCSKLRLVNLFCQCVLMASYGWWVELMMQKEELRYAEAIDMALYVMTAGTWQMPVLSVGSLDLTV